MIKNSIIILLLCQQLVFAQNQIVNINGNKFSYKKPGTFDFITKAPINAVKFGKLWINKDNVIPNLIMLSSTLFLVYFDQPIYEEISKLGRQWRIGNNDNTKTMLSVKGFPIFRGPTDVGSAMYFIGDGWTHLALSLSFLTAGLINGDYRALQTASQIAQGMLTVGLTTQLLKHITGRETPSRATKGGGVWRFFPNQIDYHKKVPNYDAFPSGHVATAMMTLTVIANNYEEYKWIRPVGYGLIALLSFQMINNGVHWMSDYPLALGIGYLFGKIAVSSGRKQINIIQNDFSKSLKVYPSINGNGIFGISAIYSF